MCFGSTSCGEMALWAITHKIMLHDFSSMKPEFINEYLLCNEVYTLE